MFRAVTSRKPFQSFNVNLGVPSMNGEEACAVPISQDTPVEPMLLQ